jgi:hypothetical protein
MTMEKEDKIAVLLILAIALVSIIGAVFGIKYVGTEVFNWFATDEGLSIKTCFFWSIGISTLLIGFFAVVAGDGLLGELPTVISGYFILIAFFTFSIFWIF